MNTNNNFIRCENLSFSYPDQSVLDNLSFNIDKGDCVGIIGANGVGKSTLLQLLVGLKTPTSGEIFIDNTKLTKQTLAEIRKKVGFVFQDFDAQLFMPTVYDDVAFGIRNYGTPDLEVTEKVNQTLSSLNILYLSSKFSHNLSGGEKKLVSLATVLVMSPDCVIFDEPTTGLDPRNRKHFINIINSLDKTKIITTHDLDMALDICNKIILLYNKKIIAIDSAKSILLNTNLLQSSGLEPPLCISNK